MRKRRVFISSVQQEFLAERAGLKAFLQGDPLLGRCFEPILFEDIPARDQRAEDRFLREVERCDLLIGIYGQQYGRENKAGLSATEREFDRAGQLGKPRLIFVRGRTDNGRHPKMVALIHKAGDQLIRRRFADTPELTAAVSASLVEELEHQGVIQTGPFDASICPGATLRDLSSQHASRFLTVAASERNFPLPPRTPLLPLLKHLQLVVDDQPTYASHASVQIMLFADRLEIWNPGQLPLPLTFESLLNPHPSIPRNPLIAEAMYLARYIERVGTGTLDITRLCRAAKLKPPQFRESLGQFVQTIYRASSAKATAQATAQAETANEQIPGKLREKLAHVLQLPASQISPELTSQAIIILELVASNSLPLDQLRSQAGLQHREHFRRFWLEAFLNANWIQRTIPDKPTSPAQKYLLTTTGHRWLKQVHKHHNPQAPD